MRRRRRADRATRARRSSRALQMLRYEVPGATGTGRQPRARPRRADSRRAGRRGRGAGRGARGARSGHRADAGRARRTCWRSARRAAELRDDIRFLLRADDPGYVYYLEIRGRGVFLRASPIDVSSIVREMLLDRMTATVLTSATLTRRRLVRLRPRPARHRRARTRSGSLRSSTTRRRRSSTCRSKMPDPRSPQFVAAAAARGHRDPASGRDGRAFVLFTSYANLREVHRVASRGARVSDPRAGHRAAIGAAARLQGDAERRPVRDLQLLAGRRRRRRGAELRDHRQAAVRVARRSDHRGADRGDQRRAAGRAFGEYQVPLAILALQAGARPAAPASAGPRRAGRPRPAAADDGLRAAIPGVAAPGACNARPVDIARFFDELLSMTPDARGDGGGVRAADPEMGRRQAAAAARAAALLSARLRPLRRAVPRQRRRVPRSATTPGLLDGREVRLSDINADIIGCYRMVRDDVEAVDRGAARARARATGRRRGEHFYEVRDDALQPGARDVHASAPIRRRRTRRSWRRC